MRVKLHIEELVLEGFSPGNRTGIGEALETELTRMFKERGLPGTFAKTGEIEVVNGGSFEVAVGARAEKIGCQIAGAVYDGF